MTYAEERPVAVHLTWLWPDALLLVVGEVDHFTVGPLERTVGEALEGGARQVVVDASALRFIDVAGARVLCSAASALTSRGGRLRVVDPPPLLGRLLDCLDPDRQVATEIAPWSRPHGPGALVHRG